MQFKSVFLIFLGIVCVARLAFGADNEQSSSSSSLVQFKPVPTREEFEHKHNPSAHATVSHTAIKLEEDDSPTAAPRAVQQRPLGNSSPISTSSDEAPLSVTRHLHTHSLTPPTGLALSTEADQEYPSDPEELTQRVIFHKPELERYQSHFTNVLRNRRLQDKDVEMLFQQLDVHTRGTPSQVKRTLFSKGRRPPAPPTPTSPRIIAQERPAEFDKLITLLTAKALANESEEKLKIEQEKNELERKKLELESEKITLEQQKIVLEQQKLDEARNAATHKRRCNLATCVAVIGAVGTITGIVVQFLPENGCDSAGNT